MCVCVFSFPSYHRSVKIFSFLLLLLLTMGLFGNVLDSCSVA